MKKEVKNPYVAGDKVRLKVDVRDAYEVWHSKGSVQRVEHIASDGCGLMFGSNLGTHFKNVELVKKAPRCKCCCQVLPLKD